MTNTQNVTELQPRMTREQLIDAARTAAKFLPVASAQLMNELANRLDITSVALCESMHQRSALAIENTVLRDDVTCWAKECDRIVERHTKKHTNMHQLEAQRELRELTPVTDYVIKEFKSNAVDELAILYRKFADEKGCSVNMQCSYRLTAERAESYASYIRSEDKTDEAAING
ncbi:hypothetical protein [Enterobacter sp. RHBSTW-00175]|uniref:hypothetical protein n=1 Tax=Enterobacter sp. RHBSTW-00175 TaxID=2742639 RepID=UPI002174F697|nr:hypothetical protein [Enterobacter sp. RHBSTW-00175]